MELLKNPNIIGLTGGIACGKSTVAAMLTRAGFTVLDADAVSRAASAPGGEAILPLMDAFANYFDGECRLDKGRLASLVFHNDEARKRLEGILHPIVIAAMERDTQKALSEGLHPIIWDVPLLFESGMDARCGLTAVVSAAREKQIERLRLRNGLSRADAAARIESQMPLQAKIARADAVIENNGTLDELAEAVERFIRILRNR